MPKPGNKTAEMTARREQVAQRYLRGMSQQAIAADLGIGQATVSRDLQALQAAWQQSAIVDLDAAKSRELARIDELERTYWLEYQASQEERLITTTERTSSLPPQGDLGGDKLPPPGLPQRDKASIRKEQRLGDPRYLAGVQWCIERRCAILGIDAPKNIDVTSKGKALKVTWANDSDDDPAP